MAFGVVKAIFFRGLIARRNRHAGLQVRMFASLDEPSAGSLDSSPLSGIARRSRGLQQSALAKAI